MRVVVNDLTALKARTGIGHYTIELVRNLREQVGADEIDCFPTGWTRRLSRLGYRMRAQMGGGETGPSSQPARASLLKRMRDWAVKQLRERGQSILTRSFHDLTSRKRYDLYHEPNYIPFPSDCPTIATIHDLSVLRHPEWHPADRVAFFERRFPEVLKRCVHFLTDSEFSRQEMIHHLGIAPERITRVALGIRPSLCQVAPAAVAEVQRRLGLPSRYLLHVGTIEPRKNIGMLLRAYCGLPAPLRSRWPLVLAGGWGWKSGDVAEYWRTTAHHKGVLHLGYVAERDLAGVYQGARALLCPSHYEGFGLPPLEMMACGGAVIASTADAHQETAAGQAHFVPATDEDGWRAAIERVVTDSEWQHELRRGASAHARPYTWERCAAETLAVYRKLVHPSVATPQSGRAA